MAPQHTVYTLHRLLVYNCSKNSYFSVATGIGVTPFSSILQSIMYRYHSSKRECPRCQFRWMTDLGDAMQNLQKVDFIWINRDQKSFEWFLNLLSMIEADQETDQNYVCENGVCNFGGTMSEGNT